MTANRIFKISAYHEEGESLTKKQLLNNLEKRINEDLEIIEKAKEANKALFTKLQEMAANPDNAEYVGAMILGQISRTPRYSYIKNIEFNGRLYDAEIDSLSRSFYLLSQETGEAI